jgi:hypothetical protein
MQSLAYIYAAIGVIPYICTFFFCCFFLPTTLPAQAQLNGKIVYPQFYTYHTGDNTTWARPEFDDSDWEQVKYGTFPHKSWQGIGWFRYVLEVDSMLWNMPLGLSIADCYGAVEFYLDGELIHRLGSVGVSQEEEEPHIELYPGPQVISFSRPSDAVASKSRHVIAIRYSSFLPRSLIWAVKSPNWGFDIGDLNRMSNDWANLRRKATIHQMFLMGVLLAFALLHLLLYLFYPVRPHANLYFAGLSVCSALVVFFIFQVIFITDATQHAWNLRIIITAGTLIVLFGIRFTHSLTYPKLSKLFIFFVLIGLSLCFWAWLSPLAAINYVRMFFLAAIIEMVRTSVVIFRRGALLKGTWIIGLGALPLLLAAAYHQLIELGILTRLWDFFDFPLAFYAMISLMISMSVFLARNFAWTNKNLAAQLVQVKELSEKTLEQELERARLEAENARKTRELEEARQLQLSMLPTEVGGDYYDFKLHDDGTLTAAIGDATGHGLQAGTMVAATKSLFNSHADESEPVSILQKTTKALKAMGFSRMYMALTIAKFKYHQMQIATAGMPFTLVYRAKSGHVEEVVLKGMPLGSFADFPYQQKKLSLNEGDIVLFMSDGLPEMFNEQRESLGDERVKTLFVEAGQKSSEQLIEHLVKAGKEWANGRAQEDDVTFVVLKMK